MAIPNSRQDELRQKLLLDTKQGHFIMTKRSIHKEDIRNINIYAPNKMYKAAIDKTKKRRINNLKIIVEDSTTSPSVMDKTIKQKTSKKMEV